MFLKILGALLLILFLYVFYKVLKRRYHTHWKSWIGVGWMLDYNHVTKLVKIPTYFLDSPAGRAETKRGSILLARNGEEVPVFESKEDFITWVKSVVPKVGESVTYRLKEPIGKDEWQEREVTLQYEKLHGTIPRYVPLPTLEEQHQDWLQLMPNFKAVYPTFRCRRTGVIYHRKRVIQVGDF
jgi:hypothetical protein